MVLVGSQMAADWFVFRVCRVCVVSNTSSVIPVLDTVALPDTIVQEISPLKRNPISSNNLFRLTPGLKATISINDL